MSYSSSRDPRRRRNAPSIPVASSSTEASLSSRPYSSSRQFINEWGNVITQSYTAGADVSCEKHTTTIKEQQDAVAGSAINAQLKTESTTLRELANGPALATPHAQVHSNNAATADVRSNNQNRPSSLQCNPGNSNVGRKRGVDQVEGDRNIDRGLKRQRTRASDLSTFKSCRDIFKDSKNTPRNTVDNRELDTACPSSNEPKEYASSTDRVRAGRAEILRTFPWPENPDHAYGLAKVLLQRKKQALRQIETIMSQVATIQDPKKMWEQFQSVEQYHEDALQCEKYAQEMLHFAIEGAWIKQTTDKKFTSAILQILTGVISGKDDQVSEAKIEALTMKTTFDSFDHDLPKHTLDILEIYDAAMNVREASEAKALQARFMKLRDSHFMDELTNTAAEQTDVEASVHEPSSTAAGPARIRAVSPEEWEASLELRDNY